MQRRFPLKASTSIFNLYPLLEEILQLKGFFSSKKLLTEQQKKIIETLLGGQKSCYNNPDLNHLKKQIEEVKKLGGEKKLISKLNEALSLIGIALAIKNKKITWDDSAEKTVQKVDATYSAIEKFGGKIVAPIKQDYDHRFSGGACYGYTTAWIDQFLKQQRFNGIDFLNPISFEYKPIMALKAKEHRFVNHVLFITNEIVYHQENRERNRTRDMKSIINDFDTDFNKLLKADINIAFRLNFLGESGDGHSVGVCKDKSGKLHFLDANFGWFVFSTVDQLFNTLKFLLASNYNKYICYSINLFQEIPNQNLQSKALKAPAKPCRDTLFTPNSPASEKSPAQLHLNRLCDGLEMNASQRKLSENRYGEAAKATKLTYLHQIFKSDQVISAKKHKQKTRNHEKSTSRSLKNK